MEYAMTQKALFGTWVEEDGWNDKEEEEDLDLDFMSLERVFDTLGGRTACMLRLDRFSSWYVDRLHGHSKYESQLKRLLLLDLEGDDEISSMDRRYVLMRAHNPLSLGFQKAFPEHFTSTEQRDVDREEWNEDEWHRVHKDGIQPFD